MRFALALLLGCAVPRARSAQRITFEYVPAFKGASFYGPPATGEPPSELRSLVLPIDADARAHGADPPQWDLRLAKMASDLARALPSEQTPPAVVVDFLAAHHGLVESSPTLLIASVAAPSVAIVATRLEARLRSVWQDVPYSNRLGIGMERREGGLWRVVVALQESHVELEPTPREIVLGRDIAVRGLVRAPYRATEAFVTRPDGAAHPLPLRVDEDRFFGTAPCTARGRHQIEILGDGAHGSIVLANFPVWCDEAPPLSVRVPPPLPYVTTADEAETELLRLVNRARATAGLPAVKRHFGLSRVARAHSQDMAAHNYVGHLSGETGSPADRVRRASLAPMLLLENVARAYSIEEAHDALMGSPGHRRNVLHPDAQVLGIGVALGGEAGCWRELWATELLAKFP